MRLFNHSIRSKMATKAISEDRLNKDVINDNIYIFNIGMTGDEAHNRKTFYSETKQAAMGNQSHRRLYYTYNDKRLNQA